MGRTVFSRIARGQLPEDGDLEESKQEDDEDESQGLSPRRRHLKVTDWIRVFAFMDANPSHSKTQVAAHFERIGLRFTRQTLTVKVEARDKIERCAVEEARGVQVRVAGDEMALKQGQMSHVRLTAGSRALRSPEAPISETVEGVRSSEGSSTGSAPLETVSPPVRRSSRIPKPTQVAPKPSLRVRRSTRLEKVPRRRVVDSSSSSFSSSEEGEGGDGDDGDDDDFAETDEDVRIDLPQPLSRTRSRTRASSRVGSHKAVTHNPTRTKIPFILILKRPPRERSSPAQTPASQVASEDAQSHRHASISRTACNKVSDKCNSVISSAQAQILSASQLEKDAKNLAPALEDKSTPCTLSLPEDQATLEKVLGEPEYSTLAPRLERKRNFCRISPLDDVKESSMHFGTGGKRPRLTSLPSSPPPSLLPSSSPSLLSPPLSASSTLTRAKHVFPAVSPTLSSGLDARPRTNPEPEPTSNAPLPTEPPRLVSLITTLDAPAFARVLPQSELEQRGFRSRLWDAWVP